MVQQLDTYDESGKLVEAPEDPDRKIKRTVSAYKKKTQFDTGRQKPQVSVADIFMAKRESIERAIEKNIVVMEHGEYFTPTGIRFFCIQHDKEQEKYTAWVRNGKTTRLFFVTQGDTLEEVGKELQKYLDSVNILKTNIEKVTKWRDDDMFQHVEIKQNTLAAVAQAHHTRLARLEEDLYGLSAITTLFPLEGSNELNKNNVRKSELTKCEFVYVCCKALDRTNDQMHLEQIWEMCNLKVATKAEMNKHLKYWVKKGKIRNGRNTQTI